jgi:monovalent cation:H+ antiporter-2, CPA2 family
MSEAGYLIDVLIILGAAVVIVPLFQRLKASMVLGFIVAGALIGPYGFHFLREVEAPQHVAELGVVFLLFTVGLELNLERLRVIRKHVLGLGTAQVVVTAGVIGLAAAALGLEWRAALIVGGALALSSTAVVLQILAERGELTTRVGRVSFAILLLQDLAAVPLIAVVVALSPVGPTGGPMAGDSALVAIATAIGAVVGMVILGRLVLRPLFRMVADGHNVEIFAAVTLFTLLGMSYATAAVGLPMELGGFLAGLLLSESEFRHQVEGDIKPFRDLLLGLFFMTVGMSVDLGAVIANLPAVLALVIALVVAKTVIIAGLCRLSGLSTPAALHAGCLLSAGGEFAFVLFTLAASGGLMSTSVSAILVAAVVISMATTPLLAGIGANLANRVAARAGYASQDVAGDTADLQDHVLIAGFGRVGQSIAKMMTTAGVPWVAIEADMSRVAEARARNLPVYFGDGARVETLRAAGVERARGAVIILDNVNEAEHAVDLLRRQLPKLQVFARAHDHRHMRRLKAAGATEVVPETYEMSLQLAGVVLRRLGTETERVDSIVSQYRADEYALLSEVIFPTASGAIAKAAVTAQPAE